MREECGMRWRGLDREMRLSDKPAFFIDGEEKKRLYRHFDYLCTAASLLSAECSGNVT